MTPDDRSEGLLEDLERTLATAEGLVTRGRSAFDDDVAIRLAFEALSNRVGEVTKQLVLLDPGRFFEPDWSFASRHRDKIVHHYDSISLDMLWSTATISFPRLRALTRQKRAR